MASKLLASLPDITGSMLLEFRPACLLGSLELQSADFLTSKTDALPCANQGTVRFMLGCFRPHDPLAGLYDRWIHVISPA